MDFDKTVKFYQGEINHLRERKDFDMLKSVAGDLKDFLRVNANKYKWSSKFCVPKGGYMEKSYKIVKDRSSGRCELCGRVGCEVHHLAGRSSLKVYNLPDFLLYVCRDCHLKFHTGG